MVAGASLGEGAKCSRIAVAVAGLERLDACPRPPADESGDVAETVMALAVGRLQSVVGVQVRRVERHVSKDPSGHPSVQVQVRLAAWSPSLHETPFVLRLPAEGADALAEAEAELGRMVDQFARRATLAARIGVSRPLPAGDHTAHDPDVEIRHLLVDRAGFAMLAEHVARRRGEPSADGLARAVRHAVSIVAAGPDIGRPGVPDVAGAAGAIEGLHARVLCDGEACAFEATVPVRTPPAPRAGGSDHAPAPPPAKRPDGRFADDSFIGFVRTGAFDLYALRGIPDSVVAAMGGRRLGEIADIHPLLADRVVRSVTRHVDADDDDFVRLRLDDDLVGLAAAIEAVSPGGEDSR